MATNEGNKKVTPEVERMFDAFRDYLYEVSGIYCQTSKRDRLNYHVQERMNLLGEKDPKKYLARLQASRGPGSELWKFFNQTTVNETYFFREEQQFSVFKDKVLPFLYEKRKEMNRSKIVIWSAASSSGDEAYSLAIIVNDVFAHEVENTSIIGFDINSEVISKAKSGEYVEYNVRHCSKIQKEKYFKQSDNKYILSSDIKKMVSFRVANFMDPTSLKVLPKPDLVLCRNVLIYFDKQSKGKVLENFASLMHEDSYLFLSQTETLFGIDHPFKPVHFFKACGYRLKG